MTTLEPVRRELPGEDSSGTRPRFSIVVPAYNEAQFIENCIDSLLRQDFQGDVEVIVVDNNSTDGTGDLARSKGVRVLHESQPGVCWARQCGTQAATGEIVISTDADTVFAPTWLSSIDKRFRENPERVAVAGSCNFVESPMWGRIYAWTLFHLVKLLSFVTGRVLYVTATNIAFRKSAWSGYDTFATQGGDELDLLRKLRARGPVTFDINNPVFTSSRRLYKGFAYNIVATFLFYYLLGYALNRITGRQVVGMAPAFRTKIRPAGRRRGMQVLVTAGVWLAVIGIVGGVSELAIHIADRI
ncbi:MAG: glycosyltransferase family 2 protein [Streptosporangiaceae bacterium]